MAIYGGMLGIAEMMEDDGFSSFILSLSDTEASRPAQEVWNLYCANSHAYHNEKELEA